MAEKPRASRKRSCQLSDNLHRKKREWKEVWASELVRKWILHLVGKIQKQILINLFSEPLILLNPLRVLYYNMIGLNQPSSVGKRVNLHTFLLSSSRRDSSKTWIKNIWRDPTPKCTKLLFLSPCGNFFIRLMLAYRVHKSCYFIHTLKEGRSKEKGRIEAGEATQRPSIPRPALYITRLSEPEGGGG